MDKRSTVSVKKVAATMAAIMLGVHTQGAVHYVSAASAVVSETTAIELGSTQTSVVLDSKLPKGAKISSEKAYNNVIALFPELKKATVESANFGGGNSYPQPDYKIWDLNFQVRVGSGTHGFSASVHGETGEVLSAYLPSNVIELEKEGSSRISLDEAEQVSEKFLRKAISGLSKKDYTQVNVNGSNTISPLFGHAQYSFMYRLNVNGIPSNDNTVYITVHDSGEVTSYHRSLPQGEFPSATPKLTEQEAKSIFEKNLNVELSYIPIKYNYNKKHSNYYLGYLPVSGMESIDASSGETFSSAYSSSGESKTEYINEDLPKNGGTFTPSSEKLNGEEAEEIVNKHFSIPDGYVLSDARYRTKSYQSGEPVWSLSWSKGDGGPSYMYMYAISAEVNANTGEIYNYSVYNYGTGEAGDKSAEETKNKPIITAASAKKKAIEQVLALVPNAAKELKLTTMHTSDSGYYFNFARYINGLPVYGDNVNISMDQEGQIISFYSQYSADAANMPAVTEPKLTQEDAIKAFLDQTKIKLQYQGFSNIGAQGEEVEHTVKLMYAPVLNENQYFSYSALDATTGKWKELYSTEQDSLVSDIVDIKGHADEALLQKMVVHGVLTPNSEGKIEPDRTITKGDWYTYLARALNPGVSNETYYYGSDDNQLFADIDADSPYVAVLNTLMNQYWLEADPDGKFSPEKQITRGELSEIIMSILKYEKLSQFYKQSTDLPGVADASQITNKGAASLAIKLDLLPLIDGRFLPERYVTVAEAAKVLNRLSELQGKLDFFMNSQSSYRYY